MAPTSLFIILMHVCTVVATSNRVTLPKFSSILVFGDSTVDTGNNNYIQTLAKGNHWPYGKDYPGHLPTGRFFNGKLVPDFIASVLNLKDSFPPFLHLNLSDEELLTGVSFASGGAGIDDLTAASLNVISLSNQIEYFKAYAAMLKHIVGENKTKQILGDALVIFSAGANDFFLNFYDATNTRALLFGIDKYQDYLHDRLQIFIMNLYEFGCRKFGVAGLAPIGCIPFQITLKFIKDRKCVEDENSHSVQYNKKLVQRLLQLQATLPGSRVVYADLYYSVLDLKNQPEEYGIEVTNAGCCGSGLIEVTPFCNEYTPLCDDASKYVFWDSIHFSEISYYYVANYVETEALPQFN